jgi:hypothetical protein
MGLSPRPLQPRVLRRLAVPGHGAQPTPLVAVPASLSCRPAFLSCTPGHGLPPQGPPPNDNFADAEEVPSTPVSLDMGDATIELGEPESRIDHSAWYYVAVTRTSVVEVRYMAVGPWPSFVWWPPARKGARPPLQGGCPVKRKAPAGLLRQCGEHSLLACVPRRFPRFRLTHAICATLTQADVLLLRALCGSLRQVTTSGSNFDTALAVYTSTDDGASLGGLEQVGFSDDYELSTQARRSFLASPGTYYIQVGAYQGTSADTLQLQVTVLQSVRTASLLHVCFAVVFSLRPVRARVCVAHLIIVLLRLNH